MRRTQRSPGTRRTGGVRKGRDPRPIALALTLAAALSPTPLTAQGWIEPAPRFIGDPVEKLRTSVRVTVEGRIARVEVEEWFVNRGGGLAEGHYMYPLPGEAVFSDVSLWQGDQELKGETMEAERARSIYEEIVRRKRDPALIELAGHGLLRARVFPIGPGETRKFALRYTQVLERSGDALQLRYLAGVRGEPLQTAPGQWEIPLSPREDGTRPRLPGQPAPLTFTVIVENGAAFHDPFSPTHEVRVTREDGRLTVRPVGTLSGDFALFLPLAGERVGMTIVTHRTPGEDGWFMLTLSPGEADAADAAPRDVTAVVDVSGSMEGEKLEQTKEALRALLASLRPADRFRLAAFGSRVEPYREGWTAATPAERTAAREWVEGLQASGGTNIAGALEEAFGAASAEGRLPIVVFLTDGLPTVGEQNPERIAARAEELRGRARVFAFGVGYDVNTLLLDRLSEAGRGSTAYVRPEESVEQAVSQLAAKVSQPVLTDLEIVGAPVRLLEVYPGPLPDLFAGEELVVLGRYRGDASGELRVSGRRGGRSESFALRTTFPRRHTGSDYLPRLWAARKIGVLERAVRLNGPNPEVVEEIRTLALRYGILTQYTAHLVVEPEMVAGGGLDAVARAGRRQGLLSPPPAAPTVGEVAVKAAESARQRREARSLDQAMAADEEVLASVGPDARVVAGRVFRQVGDEWVEGGAGAEERRVVTIQAFGPEWFALAQRVPELEAVLGAFERVVVRGARVDLRVAENAERLTPAALDRLVADLRGS